MLRQWDLSLLVRTDGSGSISLRIARAVIEEIQRGRLVAGDPLPGTRNLAEELHVNRKTVVAAYEELAAQGWVTTDRRRGTFVADLGQVVPPPATEPPPPPPAFARARGVSIGPPLLWPPTGRGRFDDGVPDHRLIPTPPIAQAYAIAARSAARMRLLGYGDPRGTEQLRRSVSKMLNVNRGLNTEPDNICITRGSQMALYVVAHALVARGDTVVFEELSYPPAVHAFRMAGAEAMSVPLGPDGPDLDSLEAICRRKRVRAIYLTPGHQFPTTIVMPPSTRLRLRALAAQFGFFIVEDDDDHAFHFDRQPLLPLASNDASGQILYVGSFSKILSPSLRVGFVAGPRGLIEQIGNWVGAIDRQGDPIAELAIVEMIESGQLRRHIKRVHGIFNHRRATLAASLTATLGSRASFEMPAGGLAIWVRFPGVRDAEQIDRQLACAGLQCLSSSACAVQSKPLPAARFGFASLDSKDLAGSMAILREALDSPAERRVRA